MLRCMPIHSPCMHGAQGSCREDFKLSSSREFGQAQSCLSIALRKWSGKGGEGYPQEGPRGGWSAVRQYQLALRQDTPTPPISTWEAC
jgi:hypothetical protein